LSLWVILHYTEIAVVSNWSGKKKFKKKEEKKKKKIVTRERLEGNCDCKMAALPPTKLI
jgi:hypothetical protein